MQEIINETATQKFHREVKELKPFLPKDWKMQVVTMLPMYDSYRGGILLHHLINHRTTDVAVLDCLKKIVELEKQNAV